MKRIALSIFLTFLLAACAGGPEPVAEVIPVPPANANAARLKIFYATDRNLTGKSDPEEKFGPDRADGLTFGVCEVLLPRDAREGEPERPTLWRLERSEKIGSNPLLDSTGLLPESDFLRALNKRISTAKGKSVLVFVHGYNVDFADAAASAAKLAYKLSFEGATIFYSWPSKGSTSEYMADEATIEWSTPNIGKFLQEVVDRTGAENIYLVAHSMGNRGLTRAVIGLAEANPKLGKRVREIILAAPDIDKGVFKRDLAPALAKSGIPVTLYAASDDRALALSKKLHSFPRVGDAGEGLVIAKGMETIDCVNAGGGFFNHSYITEDAAVLADIFYLVHKSMRAGERAGLNEVRTPEGRYWKLGK